MSVAKRIASDCNFSKRVYILALTPWNSYIYINNFQIICQFFPKTLHNSPSINTHNTSQNFYLEWNIIYFGQKNPIKMQIFSIWSPWLDWVKFTNSSLMLLLKPWASNFFHTLRHSSLPSHLNCSVIFLLKPFIHRKR